VGRRLSSFRKLLGPLAWLGLMAAALPAGAHDLGLARAELRETNGGCYELDVTVSARPGLLAEGLVLPPRCTLAGSPRTLKRPGVAVLQFAFTCAGPPLGPGDTLHLPWTREGAFVTARWRDGSTSAQFFAAATGGPAEGGVSVPMAALRGPAGRPLDIARRYFRLGIQHILSGYDHLAFVLCLCLLARGWRLVKLVTGFTLGHSLSLALAALDVVRLPSPPVEACIALSIAFVAREALRPPEARRHGVGLVFAFGLLHGLGFAGALKEAGIGTAELLLGLLSFNLGVEAGQLLFVAAVLAAVAAGRLLSRIGRSSVYRASEHQEVTFRPILPGRQACRTACATGLGAAAVFWTLQRVSVFSPGAAGLALLGSLAALIGRAGIAASRGEVIDFRASDDYHSGSFHPEEPGGLFP
jgi:hypothetical protein